MRLWKPHDLGRSCLPLTIRHHVTNQTDPQNAGALLVNHLIEVALTDADVSGRASLLQFSQRANLGSP